MFQFYKVSLVVVISWFLSRYDCLCDDETLQLVHVLFRHGNRTLDFNTSYPTDPYINETYFPYGAGQLTNKGKNKAYLLGKALRLRYDKFLGSIYFPDIIDPVSTEYNRTKMSLELVLAGLFPPKGTVMEWNTELNWQPIPYNYIKSSSGNNLISSSPFDYCPKYLEDYKQFLDSSAGKNINKRYKYLYKYLSTFTGANITGLYDVYNIYLTLVVEDDWGFTLPSWTNPIYPTVLDVASGQFYISSTSTPEMKQLTGGFLLQKIIDDTRAKITQHLNPPDRKMFMYSAHDTTVAYFLRALNVFYPHQPTYSSYVLVEVHKMKGVHGIKIYYQNYKQSEPKLMKVPECEEFCPFDKFVRLLQANLPRGSNPCNNVQEE